MEEDDPSFLSELDYDTHTHEDWEYAGILLVFLKNFYDITNKMSKTLYITANDYFNEIATLYKTLKQVEKASDISLKVMGAKMKEKFDKYYGSFEKVNMMVLIGDIGSKKKDELCAVFSCDRNLGIDIDSSWDPDNHEEGKKDDLDLVEDFNSDKVFAIFLREEKKVSAVVETLICTQDWLRKISMPINVEECIENAERFEWDMNNVHSELTDK
ncbi:uncharacterized protein LOC120287100 [Eucalyptus grandis]|uniref:uncharacterized protein LOC120287100 n=1 Tax=Eucalyptus grandis TaxID=71139 RepID=UPI00192EC024|nr:uncharacterized protein LOC120287100 [Eucalyptus grandis]